MANHTKLLVWHRANALSLAVHRACRGMVTRDAPGLKSQLLRAAASIPANIAEGAGHRTDAQFAHYLTMAIGSANEADAHLQLARGLELLHDADGARIADELGQVRRMLLGLRKHVQSRKS